MRFDLYDKASVGGSGSGLTEAQASLLYQATNSTLTRVAGIGAGTTGDILYRDATGWTNLAKGTEGQFLAVTATVPAWSNVVASGSGTKTIAVFRPDQAQPPSANFATLDTRNSVSVLEFDGGSTDESTVFVGVIPEAAVLTSGISIIIHWAGDTATSGVTRWGVQFERVNTDLDADSFDTSTESNGTANGTSGIVTVTTITATSIDSLTAGDGYRLKIYREASDTGNDTMSGDAQLVLVEVRTAN